MNRDELKRRAGETAAQAVRSGMIVGLGTGSTAVYAVRAIGRMLVEAQLVNILGIPTSEATAREAKRVGIPLTTFEAHPAIDVTIDGADEIAPNLDLIKGLGGALLREKVVAVASRWLIIAADDSKKVSQLGTRAPVPVEVIPFATAPVQSYLAGLGVRPILRMQDEQAFITDEGNIILDCHAAHGIADPAELARAIRRRPGVVEHGLFLQMAATAVVAYPDGIEILGQPISAA
jgi:ribose 5-phosphate isomerase A